MEQRRDAYPKLTAVVFFGQGDWHGLAAGLQIGDYVRHYFLNALERFFGCFS